MAYTPGTLDNLFGGPIEGTAKLWVYRTTDSLATVLGAAYVTNANSSTTGGLPTGNKISMNVGDLVLVTNQSATVGTGYTALLFVSAISSVGATLSQSSSINAGPNEPRNMLNGGDATTNPWQRGTSITGIVATNTYTADRWFAVAGTATSATVARSADTSVSGFAHGFFVARQSGQASVSAVIVGQVLETLNSVRAQGQPVTFSFFAKSASGYTGGSLGVRVGMGTGTDQSASSFVNTTWTGYSDVISATQAITATATRYVFTGNVPTSATQIGVSVQFTPVGTNTGNDAVTFYGFQLETGSGATPYEHLDEEIVVAQCQRYFYQIFEGTANVVQAIGLMGAANAATFVIPLPVTMRAIPTVSVVAGSFAQINSGATIAVAGFGSGISATTATITVVSTASGTAGLAVSLIGRNGNSGNIAVSADL
jgi:hypothetical protein